jgi:hypothetical protein
LRARLEQTQLEDLTDAFFLGKFLVLPANVRLDWKVFARHKHSSLFGLIISSEGKKFYNIDTWSTSSLIFSITLLPTQSLVYIGKHPGKYPGKHWQNSWETFWQTLDNCPRKLEVLCMPWQQSIKAKRIYPKSCLGRVVRQLFCYEHKAHI